VRPRKAQRLLSNIVRTGEASHFAPRSFAVPVLNLGLLFAFIASPLLPSADAQEWARKRADQRADKAVDRLIEEKAEDANWETDPNVIETDERSRYHDPNDANDPPQPPDDPVAHQLMRKVDGKPGSLKWRKPGDPSAIEGDAWIKYLPLDDEGRIILNSENAIRLALLHSRDYQSEREDLYLSALAVTQQRFRFDSQLLFTNRTDRTLLGGRRNGEKGNSTDTTLGFSRSTATGADLVASLANSVLWDISGSSDAVLSSVVNFGVVQPLLRFSARDFILEDLTQSERNLLGNVRRMKQFQQGFYIETIAGRTVAVGPTTGSLGLGSAPLVAGSPSSRGAGGFLGLLQNRQQIRNQEASVSALQDSLAQLQAAFDAGRISNRLQVDQARQALYNGQSSLLTSYASFDSSVDSYKVSIGLPPEVDVVIEDAMLEDFELVDPLISELQSRVARILDSLRLRNRIEKPEDLERQLNRLLALEPIIERQIDRARNDLTKLQASLPERRQQMERLMQRPELQNVHMDPTLFDASILEGLSGQLDNSLGELQKSIRDSVTNLSALKEVRPSLEQLDRARGNVVAVTTGLSSQLLELSLIQASARLETVTLKPIELDFDYAFDLAEDHRLDWMNARAGLVDSWRQIAVDAEALKSGLNLIVNGDIPTTGDDAFDFRGDSGRLQFGIEFDTPLRKVSERNDYKSTLIDYQRARRSYMLFEDRVTQSLRNTMRITQLSQLNFEVRRAAVRVAIAQVDLARLRLNEPPKPGARGAQFGATTARDLVSALGDLLDAQNDFLDVWVSFEVLRMLLDFELGTMRLDEDGLWVDPGPITAETMEGVLAGPVTLEETQVDSEGTAEAETTTVADVEEEIASESNKSGLRGILAIFGKKKSNQ